MLQEVDWPTVISGTGVFLTTCFITYKGWQDRKKEIAKDDGPAPGAGRAQFVAGIIQDNASIRENTEAVKDLTAAINRQCDLLLLNAAIAKLKE